MGLRLRQGDPLLPFLFLIVAEGFHMLMRRSVELSLFTSFKFDDEGYARLQYTDYMLIIGGKGWGNIRIIKEK